MQPTKQFVTCWSLTSRHLSAVRYVQLRMSNSACTLQTIQQRGKTSVRGMDTVMAMTTEQCSKTSIRVKQCLQTTEYIQRCSKTSLRVKRCLQTTEYIQQCSKTSLRGMATKMDMQMQMKDWPSWGTGSALPLQQRNVWLPLDEMVRGWTTEPVSDSSSQQ